MSEVIENNEFNGAFAKLVPELQRALKDCGYKTPSPIQEQCIVPLLEGRDLLGAAQTGTGKTAAFVLPLLHRYALKKQRAIASHPRALILAPTRELAAQIGESIDTYGKHLHVTKTVIFGGVKQGAQVKSLQKGKHILVATPGRLLDLITQKHISLDKVDTFILDEADRMLDMGFLPDMKRVISLLPFKRQSLFFSATLAREVVLLAKTLVRKPVEVTIEPDKPAVEAIDQSLYYVDQKVKQSLLTTLLDDARMDKVIVFCRMKYGANRIADKLTKSGIPADAIHGNKSQNARLKALDHFKRSKIRVLVATDIAARGIDVDRVSHVINFDLPNEPATYIHRIGRTARAGMSGDAISFCAAEERSDLKAIEAHIRKRLAVVVDHPYHSRAAQDATGASAKPQPKQQRPRRKPQQGKSREFSDDLGYSKGKGGGSRHKRPGRR